MSLNLPSCEVKNRLTFYKVRWFKYRFCNSVYSMFQKFFADQQIFFLKWRIKWIRFWVQCTLWSTKLLLCFWLEANFFFFFFFFCFFFLSFFWVFFFFFFSNGHIHNVVSALLKVVKIYVEIDNIVSTLSNIVQINVEIDNVELMLFNVVNFNIDVHNIVSTLIRRWSRTTLTLYDVAT